MYGLIGKILRVNLTKGTVEEEYLSESIVRKYLGGRGLGTRIYMNEVDSKTDAFDPENKLILMTGPLTGTLATSGGRLMWVTKAPLTGTADFISMAFSSSVSAM